LEADNCVPLLHVHLRHAKPDRSVHKSSLFFRRLHATCPIAHTSCLESCSNPPAAGCMPSSPPNSA
jgi:hypothetical protein